MNSRAAAVVPCCVTAIRACAMDRRGAPRGVRGFTLLEIIVALSLLAIGLGLAMQIATGAMRNAKRAAERTEAALYAQSLLDGVGVGERLEVGRSTGEFGDDYRWELDVSEHEIEAPDGSAGIDPALAPVQLYRLELLVSWGEPRPQEARFVTLRALTPDAGITQ